LANSFYTVSGYPQYAAKGDSASARAEFAAIQAGFDLMPTLAASGLFLVRVNNAATALESVAVGTVLGTAVLAPLMAAAAHAATSKTPPVDADEFHVNDSAGAFALVRITWANIKAAMFAAWGVLTAAGTAKTTPVAADTFAIADSAAGNATKSLSWANLLTTIIGTVNSWTKAQIGTPVALSVAANAVAVDLSLGNNFTLALQATTAQTLSNPTNSVAGQSGQIAVTQNATPSVLNFGTSWLTADGSTPAVSTTAGTVNLLTYYVVDATHVWFSISKRGIA